MLTPIVDYLRPNTPRPRFAVLADRDGVLIEESDYLSDPAQVRLLPCASHFVKSMRILGGLVAVVSNQSGVARGLMTVSDVTEVNRALRQILEDEGADLDAILFCPHYPKGLVAEYSGECLCRKPKPGMFTELTKHIVLSSIPLFVVGDRITDVEFAHNIAARACLVRTGVEQRSEEHLRALLSPTDTVCADLAETARWVERNVTHATKQYDADR